MNFIERWLHIAPDGGDGSTEMLCLLLVAVIVISIPLRHKLRAALRSAVSSMRRIP